MGPIQLQPSLLSSSSFHASLQGWKSQARMMTFLHGLAETQAAGTIHHSIKEQKSLLVAGKVTHRNLTWMYKKVTV